MVDPTTVNIALAVPTRGSDVGVWDVPVNGDFSSLDGHLGGVVTVGLTNSNLTLSAPTGSITPSPGPTQAENAVIRLTGTLTANVQVTLPLPGPIIIENLTTGNFTVTFAAVASGEVIATQQGTRTSVYNDGTNVRFVDLGKPGDMEFWAGLSAMPAWVTACTVKPFLLCDGTATYTFTDFPYLGPRMGSSFGGNGITTFGVPGLGGRVPLAYDYTGTRITTAGSGLNGQTMGAAVDTQSVTLTAAQIPPIASNNPSQSISVLGASGYTLFGNGSSVVVQAISQGSQVPTFGQYFSNLTFSGSNNINVISNNTGGLLHPNVQPSQVAGIWVIKT